MPEKTAIKTMRKKRPKQFFWDETTERDFTELVKDYDEEDRNANGAIVRLIKQAIKDWYIPGYLKKDRKKPVNNEMTDRLNRLSKNS
jgi:hypothetical protein